MHTSAVAILTGDTNHLNADDKPTGPPAPVDHPASSQSKARAQRTPRRASGSTEGDGPHADGNPPDVISRILGSRLLFSVGQTAEVLGQSRNWVYVSMRHGRLKYIWANRRRRVTRSEVERHLREGAT
jgi:hypothetical protein